MQGLADFIKKISDGITSFADLLDKSDFKDQLGKAGIFFLELLLEFLLELLLESNNEKLKEYAMIF